MQTGPVVWHSFGTVERKRQLERDGRFDEDAEMKIVVVFVKWVVFINIVMFLAGMLRGFIS